MLRRTTSVLRIFLVATGFALVLWLPASWFVRVGFVWPRSDATVVAGVENGVIVVSHLALMPEVVVRVDRLAIESLADGGDPLVSPFLDNVVVASSPLQLTTSADSGFYISQNRRGPRTWLSIGRLDPLLPRVTKQNIGILPGSPRLASAVRFPISLLAFLCLAWPVTSLLVRRRRRGRGFEVETNAAGDSAAVPPNAAGGRG